MDKSQLAQIGLGVCHVPFQVASDNGHLKIPACIHKLKARSRHSMQLRNTGTSLKQSLREFWVVWRLSCANCTVSNTAAPRPHSETRLCQEITLAWVAARSLFVKSMRPFRALIAWCSTASVSKVHAFVFCFLPLGLHLMAARAHGQCPSLAWTWIPAKARLGWDASNRTGESSRFVSTAVMSCRTVARISSTWLSSRPASSGIMQPHYMKKESSVCPISQVK